MRSSPVNTGDNILATQYDALRQDAAGGAMLLVHQQATPGMTLYVEPGVAYVGATRVIYAGGNTPTITAPVSNPRIDLITIDSSGTIAVTTGTENASPVAPTYPASKLVLAEVYNKVGETSLKDTSDGTNGYISNDVRPVLGGSYIASDSQVDPAAAIQYSKLNSGSINVALVPDATDTRNLGAPGTEWNDVYGKTYHGDGSQLTGLQSAYLSENYTAGGSIAAGAGVSLAEGGTVVQGPSNAAVDLGATGTGSNGLVSAGFGTNVWFYTWNSGNPTINVGYIKLNSDGTITKSEAQIYSSSNGTGGAGPIVRPFGTSACICIYYVNSGGARREVQLCTVTNGTISGVTSTDLNSAGATAVSYNDVVGVSIVGGTYTFVAAMIDDTGAAAWALTWNGTTLTVGSRTAIQASPPAQNNFHLITTGGGSDFQLLYTSATSTQSIFPCTVSGTTITTGSASTVVSAAIAIYSYVLGTTHVFAYINSGMKLRACTISGTTPTLGTEATVNASATAFAGGGALDALDSTHLAVAYAQSGVKANFCTLSGTTFTVGSTCSVNAAAVTPSSIGYLSSTYAAVAFSNTNLSMTRLTLSGTTATIVGTQTNGSTATSPNFTTQLGANTVPTVAVYDATANHFYKFNPYNFGFIVGLAKQAYTSGQTVKAVIAGIVQGLSGLTPQTIYYLDATTGALTTTSSGNTKIGFALDATELQIYTGSSTTVFL